MKQTAREGGSHVSIVGKNNQRQPFVKRSDRRNGEDTRTHKVFQALDEICLAFDLGKPIWLASNIEEFQRHAKTRFSQDQFIETIPFDYLEIHVIEED